MPYLQQAADFIMGSTVLHVSFASEAADQRQNQDPAAHVNASLPGSK
jgi:hypothetical protein